MQITIRNRHTGAMCQIEAEVWKANKRKPEFKGLFEVVRTIKEPPEVAELKAKLSATK